ncbi:hypothetical protein LTR95_000908 [Oleoguttula sp. CCFEE 5521]
MSTISPAKIVSQNSYLAAGRLKITEHFFTVPKDHSAPSSSSPANTLTLFARSVTKAPSAITPSTPPPALPWLLYLQGGPGYPCRPPQHSPMTQILLDKGYQLLFLDQRGTGLSTPVTASTLQMRGEEDVQVKYLKLYRADSIVKDCEAIRLALTEGEKWSILGQSFGGFCSVTYLSFYPEGLREVFLFGGLMPLVRTPDEVYRRLYPRVKRRNKAYYAKFPEDVGRVKKILSYLGRFGDGVIKLPSGGDLTRRRFLQLGLAFGGHGGLDSVHDIVLKCATDIDMFGHLTRNALSAVDGAVNFDDALLYAILHEPIYCSGKGNKADWSAQRVRDEFSEFTLDEQTSIPTNDSATETPINFSGEMVYPWMFSDYTELRKVSRVAERVAQYDDWSELFDEEQLAKNEVPIYAAAYQEDMYVDYELSMQTAAKIKGCKVFSTNVLYHDAVRSRVEEVMKGVFGLRDDVVD